MLLNIIKIISLLAAGLFGLVGTFKDFSVDARAGKWRKWTIAGIVLPTFLSVVIQNVEYLKQKQASLEAQAQANDTATKLKAITDETGRIVDAQLQLSQTAQAIQSGQSTLTTTAQTIQHDQTTTLNTTEQVRSQVGQSLVEQKQIQATTRRIVGSQLSLLGRQNDAIVSIDRILNPFEPVSVTFTLEYSLQDNPCLKGYAERLKQFALPYVLEANQSHNPNIDINLPNTGVKIRIDPQRRGLAQVEIQDNSPMQPNSATDGGDPVSLLKTLGTSIKFHVTEKKPVLQAGSGYGVNDGVEYYVGLYDRTGGRKGVLDGFLPRFGEFTQITVHYDRDFQAGGVTVALEVTALGVTKQNSVPSVRSITQLSNSILEVYVSAPFPASQCFRPALTAFELRWGANYVNSTDFNLLSSLETFITPKGVSFVHSCSRKEFGITE